MVQNENTAWSTDDTLRVLIASDIHLGYQENDPIRGEDSFIAFEEILSQAVQYDVDLILLGGDLFDQAKPSPNSMFKCTQIIRKYCLGDKPITVELLSDQLQNFARTVNYEDPNLNVSYPILSIHGNHDDPVGQSSISSLDILSITGLVNYFGKWTDYTQVRISPVLMQKGETKLALYGLSHLKDQRLSRLFHDKKVEMERMEDGQDWFNLLVLHQNRADRGPGNYIPEKVLPKFLDMVIWGHEHDSQVYPIKGSKRENDEFYVVQPGSSVATSLAAGEALPKHSALLQICKEEFILTPLPLQRVRPFIFKTIVLSEQTIEGEGVNENEKIQSFLSAKMHEAIGEADQLRSGDEAQPKLPLVRLSVFFERDGQDFNRIRFGQNFNGLVANPNDVLLMKREKKIRERREKIDDNGDGVEVSGVAAEATDVETLIRAYYAAQPPDRRLSILSVHAMTEAIRDFTLKRDDDVFRRVLDAHRRRCVDDLLEAGVEGDDEIAERMRLCKEALDAADGDSLRGIIAEAAGRVSPPAAKKSVLVLSSDDEAEAALPPPATRGRGKGARATRAARGPRGRGRAKVEREPSPEPIVERRSTPRRSAAQKNTSWLQSMSAERSSRRRRGSSDIDDSN